jgi:epoxyqueuosine reductase QueG
MIGAKGRGLYPMGKEIIIKTVQEVTERFIKTEAGRLGSEGWWQRPLVATASIDQRFDELPDVAYHKHLHPRDLLPTARSVVVFFIPFKKALIKENRKGDRPCRNWGVAYVQTNDLIGRFGSIRCSPHVDHACGLHGSVGKSCDRG